MTREQYRVLIVDDEPMVRQIASRAFLESGLVCDTAADGELAAAMLAEQNYHAVVTDLRMPNRNGHALVVEIMSQPEPPVVVVVTSVVEARLARDLIIRGVDRIEYKPVDYIQLAELVRKLCLERYGAPLNKELPLDPGNGVADELSDTPADNWDDCVFEDADLEAEVSQNPKTRLLYVDDEAMLRDIAMRAFVDAGFACDTASNGDEAAEMFSANPYDVVITDLRMPARNGHSLACELTAHSSNPLVVVTTAVCEPRLSEDLYERGVALIDYKPVNFEILTSAIRELISQRESKNCQPEKTDIQKKAPLTDEAVQVYFECTSPEFDPDGVADCIESQSDLQKNVFVRANSGEHGLKPVTSTREAVIRLGSRKLSEIALMSAQSAAPEKSGDASGRCLQFAAAREG